MLLEQVWYDCGHRNEHMYAIHLSKYIFITIFTIKQKLNDHEL